MNIPIFVQQIIGVVIRAAVIALATWVASHGGPKFTDDQVGKAIAEATPVAAVLAWSIYQKFKSRQKLLTAQASGGPVSENHVEMMVGAGQAPSVMTAKHDTPVLSTPPPNNS
jgi:hypothetical protein